MEETQATPQTQRRASTCRLEASLVFPWNEWSALQELRKRLGDKTSAHLIKRALALLASVEPHAHDDNVIYVLDHPPCVDEQGVYAIKI